MRPSRDGIVRPLLCIGRAETAEVCRTAGIAPREDPTNRSLRFARNRIRRKVLPELAAINPQVTSALARIADAAADIASSQRERAAALLDASTTDGAIDLDALGMDGVLREEALAIAWERATGHVLTARHRAAVAAQAARGDGQAALDLPGGRLIREHRSVRIERHESAIRPS
jgi:tRNA(Ile)-lysidine synthase